MQDIVIVGAGGFAREVLALIEKLNEESPKWNVLGFIDDNLHALDNYDLGYSILGTISEWTPIADEKYAMAIASPSAIVSVVLDDGTSPMNASLIPFIIIVQSEVFSRMVLGLPTIENIFAPIFWIGSSRSKSSFVPPLLLTKITMSCGDNIPKSPCKASTGFKYIDLMPRLLIVDAFFVHIIPLLPTPVHTMVPWHSSSCFTNLLKSSPSDELRIFKQDISLLITRFATSRYDIFINSSSHHGFS